MMLDILPETPSLLISDVRQNGAGPVSPCLRVSGEAANRVIEVTNRVGRVTSGVFDSDARETGAMAASTVARHCDTSDAAYPGQKNDATPSNCGLPCSAQSSPPVRKPSASASSAPRKADSSRTT